MSKKELKIIDKLIEDNKRFEFDSKMITDIGKEEMKELKELSSILDKPIKDLVVTDSENTVQSHISKSLIKIKTEADSINPAKFDFNPGFFGRIIQKVTGSSTLSQYANKFLSAKEAIESINDSLNEGIIILNEDIETLEKDQKRFKKTLKSLEEKIIYLQKLNAECLARIDIEENEEIKKFLQENVLYELSTHILDLQTVQSATMQGVVAIDILIKNNKELIKGVKRTRNVAIPVLSIGFTIASGLHNQQKVLDVVQSVNKTTSEVMLANAEMLKTQGTKIQRQATESLLDLNDMKKAVETLISAVEEVESFKVEALPKMQKSIEDFNNLSVQLESKIKE